MLQNPVKEEVLKTGKWQCWKCGACCFYVGRVHPDLDSGNLTCRHLQKDNSCGIYDTRGERCTLNRSKFTDKELIEWCTNSDTIMNKDLTFNQE